MIMNTSIKKFLIKKLGIKIKDEDSESADLVDENSESEEVQ